MEHFYLLCGIAAIIGGGTILGSFIAGLKSADWLISIKYKSKEECSKTRHVWEEAMSCRYATKEDFKYIKEDLAEIKQDLKDLKERK